jgi:hypothetical protein
MNTPFRSAVGFSERGVDDPHGHDTMVAPATTHQMTTNRIDSGGPDSEACCFGLERLNVREIDTTTVPAGLMESAHVGRS